MIYLDSAATSLIRPQAVEMAMLHALRSCASPGRGAHPAAMNAADTVYRCRCSAATLFNVKDAENIVFTLNATHALNIAISSLIKPCDRVLISGFEHNSVTRPLHELGADIITAGRKLFDPEDTIDAFRKKIDSADAVICTHVSNAFGYILPIYEISELCRLRGKPLIIDASQSAGCLELDASRLSAAFIAMPGHKGLLGPQGTGMLICNALPKAFMQGGSGSDSRSYFMPDYLPDRAEAGTHNVCGIAGLNAGLEYLLKKGVRNVLRHEKACKDTMVSLLKDDECIKLYYTDREFQSGVLSVNSGCLDCESLAQRLAERGVCVRAGLHCAPCAHESAGTLEWGTVRLSFSPFTNERELRFAAEHIKECCR